MAKRPEDDLPFRIYPRKPRVPFDVYGRMPTAMRRVMGHVKKIQADNQRRKAPPRRRRIEIPGPRSIARIEALTSQQGKGVWRAAGKYLQYNKAGQGESWEVFGPDGPVVDPRERADQWQRAGDVLAYKIVISPQYPAALDLKLLTREVMSQINSERFLTGAQGQLEYMAAVHYDTAHPHVHILLRARAGGQEFRLPWDIQFYGIRRHVAAAITEQRKRKEKQNVGIPELPRGSTERSMD